MSLLYPTSRFFRACHHLSFCRKQQHVSLDIENVQPHSKHSKRWSFLMCILQAWTKKKCSPGGIGTATAAGTAVTSYKQTFESNCRSAYKYRSFLPSPSQIISCMRCTRLLTPMKPRARGELPLGGYLATRWLLGGAAMEKIAKVR